MACTTFISKTHCSLRTSNKWEIKNAVAEIGWFAEEPEKGPSHCKKSRFFKILFLHILLLPGAYAIAQQSTNGDSVLVSNTYFKSLFVCSQHTPALVEYKLTKPMVNCTDLLDRKKYKFRRDPALDSCTNLDDDYTKSGYDRGHLMSARSNACFPVGMRECFYFSNMFPQVHSLNAGVWFNLEEEERNMATVFDSIKVFVGGLGKKDSITHGNDKIIVPAYCWKVIYVPKTNKTFYYLFKNAKGLSADFDKYLLMPGREVKKFEDEIKMKFRKGKVHLYASTIKPWN